MTLSKYFCDSLNNVETFKFPNKDFLYTLTVKLKAFVISYRKTALNEHTQSEIRWQINSDIAKESSVGVIGWIKERH